MKKIIINLIIFCFIHSLNGQNEINNYAKISYNCTKSVSDFINKNLQEDLKDPLFNELGQITKIGDIQLVSNKFFDNNNSENFSLLYIQYLEGLNNLKNSNATKDDFYAILKEDNLIDRQYCRNWNGYEQCMKPVDDDFEAELIDNFVEFVGGLGAVIFGNDPAAILGGIAAANAGRKAMRAIDKHAKERGNCFELHCK